ncbi:hypothetical protein MRB53_042193 [Persea americana]|nr:hypothetical protein MRB53_042193 [Persea americana]
MRVKYRANESVRDKKWVSKIICYCHNIQKRDLTTVCRSSNSLYSIYHQPALLARALDWRSNTTLPYRQQQGGQHSQQQSKRLAQGSLCLLALLCSALLFTSGHSTSASSRHCYSSPVYLLLSALTRARETHSLSPPAHITTVVSIRDALCFSIWSLR